MYTVRTMGAYTAGGADLVWYGAAGDRTNVSISAFGILDDFRGVLIRDDFGGYLSYDDDLAGVQQCLAHVIRYLDDAHAIDTDTRPGPAKSPTPCAGRSTRSTPPASPTRPPPTPACSPGCGAASTRG